MRRNLVHAKAANFQTHVGVTSGVKVRPMQVACPTCGSEEGRQCRNAAGDLTPTVHRDRRRMAIRAGKIERPDTSNPPARRNGNLTKDGLWYVLTNIHGKPLCSDRSRKSVEQWAAKNGYAVIDKISA